MPRTASDPAPLLLLVEDEFLIAASVADELEQAGYAILVCSSSASGMECLESNLERLAGLITDIRLGSGPSGWDIARRARELNPGLPVVYMTGDSAEHWAAQGVPASVLIQKPFAAAQAAAAISSLLNHSG